MRIWLINHYAVPPQYYPLARPTYFAKHLMGMGHEVTVFAASTVHNSDRNLIEDRRAWVDDYVDGVHYVYIRCRDYQGNGLSRSVNMCQFAAKLPGVCRHYEKPDAIVATSMPPMSCAMGIRLARKYGCKGIAEIADLWPESIVAYDIAGPKNPAVRLLRRLEKWIYTRADTVVFTMEGAYDYIREQGWEREVPQSKVRFINNGVDLEVFDENRERYPAQDGDLADPELFKVVYTGSIRRVNNLGKLLDVAKLVRTPNVRFLIWGDGDELEALQQRVRDEGIGNVTFKGRVDKKFIPGIVSRADLNLAHNTASPLFRFGISFNKVFEYLAAGRPILCDFPCPYNPVLQEHAGFSVESGEVGDIAAKIEEISAYPADRLNELGRNARNGAEHYDFKALTEKLSEILQA